MEDGTRSQAQAPEEALATCPEPGPVLVTDVASDLGAVQGHMGGSHRPTGQDDGEPEPGEA